MSPSTIIANFEKYIHHHFFRVETNVRKILLTEEKGREYEVQLNVSRAENRFLLINNLEELKKEYATYLKQHPKDCDYIILDLYEKNIFLIELKDTDVTNVDIMNQLNAGQKWLEHLLFCCDCTDSILDWETFKIGVRYHDTRPSRSKRVNQNNRGDLQRFKEIRGENLITFKGKTVNLDAFVN